MRSRVLEYLDLVKDSDYKYRNVEKIREPV